MVRRTRGREIVYVERGGDASAKWLFWGAVLGAGLALLYAPRTGEETRRVLQRKLWKLRAMTEEKLDDIAQQFGSGKDVLEDLADDDDDFDEAGRHARASAARRRVPPRARSSSGAWPSPARAGGRWATTRSRSPETGPARWVAPHARRLPPPHPAGRRREQHPLSGERAHLRRAAGGRAVRPAGADRPDPPRPGDRRRSGRRSHAAVPPILSAPHLRARPRSVRPRGASADRGVPEPGADLALRRARVHLVQHPAVRRRSHLAQRRLRRVRPADAAAPFRAQLAGRQAARHLDGHRHGGAVPA